MDNPEGFDLKKKSRLHWTETFVLIYSFFLLVLPGLLIFGGAVLLVTVLVMFWLK
jgi:hypothetical protein